MADDFANAYATPNEQPVRTATPPSPEAAKPGLWALVPVGVPERVQEWNDALVEQLLIQPLERVDRHLAKARERVDAVTGAAYALLFRSR